MTDEEILEAAKKNNNGLGECEEIVLKKSLAYGSAVGIALCTIMIFIELITTSKIDYGKPMIILGTVGFSLLYEGVNNQNRKKKYYGCIMLVFAIIALAFYIGALFQL